MNTTSKLSHSIPLRFVAIASTITANADTADTHHEAETGGEMRGDPVQHATAVASLRAAAEDLDQERQSVVNKLLIAHGDASQVLNKHYLEWSEITRKELVRSHADTLYLSYSLIDEDRSLLIATSDSLGVRTFELPIGEGGWIARIKVWLDDIKADGKAEDASGSSAEATEAHNLFNDLLGPLETARLLNSKIKKIVIVADGVIATLPFSALIDSHGERLAQTYVLSYAESLSLLTLGETADDPTETLLCVANPNGNLPSADQEGARIAGIFHGSKMRKVRLLGDDANTKLVTALMPEYAVVHFACDGYLDSSNSFDNGLILSSKQGQDDSVLMGTEIMWTPMKARLVVLSACETAVSEFNGGDGIQGLVWDFQAANCPTVVASRWKVNDNATGDLMDKFYARLLAKPASGKTGSSVAEALRDAEVDFITSKSELKWRKPYYWAAFDVFGRGEIDRATLRLQG